MEALTRRSSFDFVKRIVRPDGSIRVLTSQGQVETDSEGAVRMVGVCQDVTERVQLEAALQRGRTELEARAAELERSNGELEQFAYAVSHDLSEPLRVAGGFLQLLSRRHGDELPPAATHYIDSALSGLGRMQDLMDALLRYSRVGQGVLRREEAELSSVAERAIQDLESAIQESGAEVRVEQLPIVSVEPILVRDLFQNLISNAIKFSEGSPRVVVSAERYDEGWRISVADNGIGIEPEQTDRIFEVFQRLHGRDVPGTGVGLAVCKRIVERHGGQMSVVPGPDGGSIFSFTIPDVPVSVEGNGAGPVRDSGSPAPAAAR
jgi:signal transduction histidine kinase